MAKPDVRWEGSFPALVTPFTEDGAIDFAAYEYNINVYIKGDEVAGLVIGGHNGEPWALTSAERVELFRLTRRTADAIKPGFPVIAGVDAVRTGDLIEEARKAEAAGADGMMVTPPFKVATASEAEIRHRFESLAAAVDLPIMLYNNPRRTGIDLAPAQIASLADIDNIVAVKQAVRDFGEYSETIRLAGDKVAVMPGPSGFIFPGILLGIKGYVASGPDVLGKAGSRLYWTVKNGDLETGRRIHHQLARLYKVLFGYGTWPAAYKVALDLVGKKGGCTRDPVRPLSPEDKKRVEASLRELGIL